MAYEKMKCLYNTERDLIDRLHNTICRYDGSAFLVSVQSKNLIYLCDAVTGKTMKEIKPSDPEFDISSPEIGYVNLIVNKYGEENNKVFFLERNPYRKFRQGLYPECCTLYTIHGDQDRNYSTGDFFRRQGLIDSIEGRFPTFREGLVKLRNGSDKQIAISRDIAMEGMKSGLIVVWCQGNDVGYIRHDGHQIEFQEDDTSWVVKRMLEKSGIRTGGY